MKYLVLTASLFAFATPAVSQHSHSGVPRETGQAAFAAIAEIVDTMRADDATDWEQVDITALRDHLVDMDLVTMTAEVETERHATGATFHVRGKGETIAAIRRMAVAHGPMLTADTGWQVSVSDTPDGVEMTVSAAETGKVEQIAALGFFGLMTVGAHHQAHHLAIAGGTNPHAH